MFSLHHQHSQSDARIYSRPQRVAQGQVRCAALLCFALFTLAACTPRDKPVVDSASSAARAIAPADTDDFGKAWPTDTAVAARIVSLIPAATEIIFAIGHGARMVGRVTWDSHPDSALAIQNVGDGIRPNVEAILATKPTLVVMFAAPENRDAAAALALAKVPVVAIRIARVGDFVRTTEKFGALFGAQPRARNVVDSVKKTLDRVRDAVRGATPVSVVWPFWHSPVLVAGSGGFESELLDVAGGRNVFADRPEASLQVTLEDVAKRNPDMVLVGPASLEKIRETPGWRSIRAVREGKFGILDTAIMGRPAVSLGMEAVSLARLLHPELADKLK